MSDRVKQKIGEENYKNLLSWGLKPEEFDLIDGFVPRARLNEEINKNKEQKKFIEEMEAHKEKTKDLLGENEDLKEKYTKLEETHNLEIENHKKEVLNISKRNVIENKLSELGAISPDLLVGKIDLEKISQDGDNWLGLDNEIERVKNSYSNQFAKQTANTNSSPGGTGDNDNNNNDDDGDLGDDFFNSLV